MDGLFKMPPKLPYPILFGVGEIFGFLSILFVGLFFDKTILPGDGYDWVKNPFSYHPLLMTFGLLFCYGNAILLYRTLKQAPKLIVKICHALLLLSSFICAIVGLVAIIRSKNMGNSPHFMTYHSWLGLTTLILFVFQWICGFVSFLVPQLSLDVRKAYMPSHRLWGKIIFLSAVITILTGLSEHGARSSFFPKDDTDQKRRLILNFFAVFTSLFSLFVIYLLSNPDYQRPPEEAPQL